MISTSGDTSLMVTRVIVTTEDDVLDSLTLEGYAWRYEIAWLGAERRASGKLDERAIPDQRRP